MRSISRAALALSVSTATCLALADCSHAPAPEQITHQAAVILDVSGSTADAVAGYASRAGTWVDQLPDHTTLTVLVADGASEASICIPRSVEIAGTGSNSVEVKDSLAAARQAAQKLLAEQVKCGSAKSNNTPGSDLIGSLFTADTKLHAPDATMAPPQVLMMSDGIQWSRDLKLTKKTLTNTAARTKAINSIDDAGLIPTKLTGGELLLSDPAVGSGMDAKTARGVTQFWTAYAKAAHTSFTVL